MNLSNNIKYLGSFLAITITLSLASCSSGGGGDDSSGGVTAIATPSSNSNSVDASSSPTAFSARFCRTQDPDRATLNNISSMMNRFVKRARYGGYDPRATFLDDLLESVTNPTAEDGASDAGGLGIDLESIFGGQEIVTIPVHFTIISKGPNPEDGFVTDAQLDEQINVMNQAYSGATGGAPTPFRFQNAGVTRVNNPDLHVLFPASPQELEVKETYQRGDVSNLNVYIVDIQDPNIPEGEGTMLGYSSLPVYYKLVPFFDGIVLNYKALPGSTANRYNIGHVLVHEAGHWLGLFHTFLGECDEFYNDLVTDTPREMVPQREDLCPMDQDSCPHLAGADPIHNHMTYTEDGCRFEFTPGQVFFMKFNALLFRQMPVQISLDELPEFPSSVPAGR